jgi:hypothetical protein
MNVLATKPVKMSVYFTSTVYVPAPPSIVVAKSDKDTFS